MDLTNMLKGLSLVELAQKITAQKSLKADYVVPTSDLRMGVDSDGTTKIEHETIGSFPVLPLAHDQIGNHLKIPAKYYDRMLAQAPDLLADNVNRWLREEAAERRMLRTMGGDLRAFLSDRYARVENEEIAEAVLPVLFDTPGLSVVSCEVTDRRLYISATTDKVKADVRVGDTVQAGVTISNSEVGLGSVSVKPFIYRLVCLNGMTRDDGKLTARHVGRRITAEEDLNHIFADDTRKADDRALLLKVRDTVKHAMEERRFQVAVDKMRGLTEVRVQGDPARAVEVLAQKVGATDDERGGILRSLIEGGDLSAWGLVNAVTAQGHGAKSYDRSMDFTALGGSLLDLPRRDWTEILEAGREPLAA